MIDFSDLFAATSPDQADEVDAQAHLVSLIAQAIAACGLTDQAASVRLAESRRVRAIQAADDARREAVVARRARDASIAALTSEGIPQAAIAAACGLTLQRVGQIASTHREVI